MAKFITQIYPADEEISHEPILNPGKHILKERNDYYLKRMYLTLNY